jgi:hypothetical protein
VAIRLLLEVIEELGCAENAIGVIGIGCYTAFTSTMDVDLVQALHGPRAVGGDRREADAPRHADLHAQGDGDMVNEGSRR